MVGAERLVDVGIGPTVVTLDSFLDSIFRSQENKDNVTKLWVVLDGLAQLYMRQAASIDTLNADKVNALKKADEIYGKVASESPGNKLYATMMRARVNSQLDPETTQGLAKPYYEEYVQLAQAEHADNPKLLIEPYLYLGYYYIVKEDNATAKTYYEKIIAIDPQNPTATQALSVLQ